MNPKFRGLVRSEAKREFRWVAERLGILTPEQAEKEMDNMKTNDILEMTGQMLRIYYTRMTKEAVMEQELIKQKLQEQRKRAQRADVIEIKNITINSN